MNSDHNKVEIEEDAPRAGALRVAQYRHQNGQMQQRNVAKPVSPEQMQEREQLRQIRERKKFEAIDNAERDAPIRDRFHAWLEGAGFRKFETPPFGYSYSSSHVQTLWEAYLDATLKERGKSK